MKSMSAAERASATFAQFFGGEPQLLARDYRNARGEPARVDLTGAADGPARL